VLKLRKRLRKKKALLETIFPNYEIKALIILNEGATGTRQFPSYCKVWFTQEFSAKYVLDYIKDPDAKELEPINKVKSPKMIEAHSLKLYPFRYYNIMSWITKTLRSHKKHILDMGFLMKPMIQRYHDLYNKFYIGFITIEDAKSLLSLEGEYQENQRVIVAIEKKYNDEIVVTYYLQKGRKNLHLYSFDENENISKEKKDPYGITVTEVFHINKMMDDSYELSMSNIKMVKKLLSQRFERDSKK